MLVRLDETILRGTARGNIVRPEDFFRVAVCDAQAMLHIAFVDALW